MSHQECAICDNCGKHEAMDSIIASMRDTVERIPVGWFAKKPDLAALIWKTYCSAICVALGEGSPPLMEEALDPASVTP